MCLIHKRGSKAEFSFLNVLIFVFQEIFQWFHLRKGFSTKFLKHFYNNQINYDHNNNSTT